MWFSFRFTLAAAFAAWHRVSPFMKLALRLLCFTVSATTIFAAAPRSLSRAELRDKIRGAWAGQMIGVTYGAPTEFHALGRTFDEPIKPEAITNAIVQDDLYVEMTFSKVLDTVGLDATSDDYGAAFAQSRYELWHANAAARRNLQRGLSAALSGDPRYNAHCDDIDFQIESDFIGILCPGLPAEANRLGVRVGRVMNHGDGLYGGLFIAGMYSAAFFESDPRRVVEAGLASIPADSGYGRIIRDLLDWHDAYPGNWRKIWQLLADKWDRDDICPEGAHRPFNIDAKLNGAYLALGLLAGNGDWQRTMEIATRCGQDSDCNPSSACGVLGAMIGFERIPAEHRAAVLSIAERKFDYTDYSFRDIVASSERLALAVIQRAGGRVDDQQVVIPRQTVTPPPLESSGYGRPVQLINADEAAWTWRGAWEAKPGQFWSDKYVAREANSAGAEAELKFRGTGVVLIGSLIHDGGRADVFIDGVKCDLVADAYVDDTRTHDNDLWRLPGLSDGEHTLRIVTRSDADPHSTGRRFGVIRAVIYRTP